LSVDFHALAPRPLDEVQALLHLPPKGPAAIGAGSPGVRQPEGMSESQRATYEAGDWVTPPS
jgi:hypothetical protein